MSANRQSLGGKEGVYGMHVTYLGRIERGVQNVGLKTIQKICKASKVTPEKLFKGVR